MKNTTTPQKKVAQPQNPAQPLFDIQNFSRTSAATNVRAKFDLQVGPVKLIGCLLIAKQGASAEESYWVATQQREFGAGTKKTYRPTAILDPAISEKVAGSAARLYQAYLPEN